MSDSSYIRILRSRLPYAQFDSRPWSPPLNVFETDREMVLVIELAGVDPATLQIEAYPEVVRIAGARQLSLPAGLRRLHRMEIAAGVFQIEVPFERPIDPEQTSARSVHGLLEIRLPFAGRVRRQVVIPVAEGERP
ncbi:Hsp20/alpha crystallin family protein [Chloroflexus sp.]|uniref:Hsp20/alpha crystallin family protein n=1 Tax=Chloroflexus sp. TaxID=1904827 RepID=UPI00298F3533|nr:Hsp20/alpha crystallin family protein [Chloroflexus sp.]MCS6887974.1 Hsp20/alpha crystallin family protein [Chloroflexus sp.]MCX7858518.1 Hsp20/alpha crystallin family protein [Chloroflexus sp.]MDW8403704.1 Hsp20/alpha crystallin family protein [Chloroflexus sp.]